MYRHLKHEGGTHRVQRIPEVGLSSRMQRIHTGTMTVIILPQPVEVHSPLASCRFIVRLRFPARLNSFLNLCFRAFCVHSLTSTLTQRIFASTRSDLEVLGDKVSTQRTVRCASFIFPPVKHARAALKLPQALFLEHLAAVLLSFHINSRPCCRLFSWLSHPPNRCNSWVSADSLSAEKQRHRHGHAEGQALPEHDG